jgi:hypothetical protein
MIMTRSKKITLDGQHTFIFKTVSNSRKDVREGESSAE